MNDTLTRVLAINASRQRRNTYTLLQQVGELLAQRGIAVEQINLHDYAIADCLGCLRCLEGGEPCVHKDDYEAILAKIKAADGLILGTPVHMAGVSGKLKTLLDRMFVQVHRPELAGTPLLTVVSTGGSSLASTHRYLEEVGAMTGLYLCGRIGRRALEMNKPVQPQEVAGFADAVLAGLESHRPALRQISFFRVVQWMGTSFIPLDREFWEARGMDEMDYFYPCQMGPLKVGYSRLFGALMRAIMPRFAADG